MSHNKPHTQEAKDKIRQSKSSISKPVHQLSIYDGTLIATYSSLHEADRITGVSRMSIMRACRGEYRQAGFYRWIWASKKYKFKIKG